MARGEREARGGRGGSKPFADASSAAGREVISLGIGGKSAGASEPRAVRRWSNRRPKQRRRPRGRLKARWLPLPPTPTHCLPPPGLGPGLPPLFGPTGVLGPSHVCLPVRVRPPAPVLRRSCLCPPGTHQHHPHCTLHPLPRKSGTQSEHTRKLLTRDTPTRQCAPHM